MPSYSHPSDPIPSLSLAKFYLTVLLTITLAALLFTPAYHYINRINCFAKYSRIGHPVTYQLPGGCFIEPYPGIFIPADQYEYPNLYPMLQPAWQTSP